MSDGCSLFRRFLHRMMLRKHGLPSSIGVDVILVNPGNIHFGSHSYMNSGQIVAGVEAVVWIGDWCAIGYHVHIKSVTHDVSHATGPGRVMGDGITECPIKIGDHCWIGDFVFIREGVIIGDHTVVGAGSIVTRSFPDGYCVVAGNPARLIRRIPDG
jgi:maltose O-acetyltransferase